MPHTCIGGYEENNYIHIYIYIYMLVERHNKMTYNLQQILSEIITHNNINVMPIKFS